MQNSGAKRLNVLAFKETNVTEKLVSLSDLFILEG